LSGSVYFPGTTGGENEMNQYENIPEELKQLSQCRYSDAAEVYIRFENNGLLKPEQYSLGWLRNMKKFEMGEKDIFRKSGETVNRLADIFSLLEYLHNNFDDVTNIEYCRKTQCKINDNFEKGIW
jgi:hypothetical protein